MASIHLSNVTLSYPILGTDRTKIEIEERRAGAGALIRDTSNRTRSVVALENISIDLKDGDRLGLIGRNGSGKSTLLRVVAGIFEPREGMIRVEGKIAGLFSLGLGMQPDASGYRNILVAGLVAGYSKEEVRQKIPEIAEFCELGEYLEMPVRTYSNGMAMRLKFACATAFNAEILLMDEWLGAGDPYFRKKAEERLRIMVDEAGILMLASHNLSVIRRTCNKLAWLDRGCLRAVGDVEEVIEIHDAAQLPANEVERQDQQERADLEVQKKLKRERRRRDARAEKRASIKRAINQQTAANQVTSDQ